jgi:hypothetical protein
MAADKLNSGSSEIELCILPTAICAAISGQAIPIAPLWAAAIKKISTSQERWRMVTRLAAGSDLIPNRQ